MRTDGLSFRSAGPHDTVVIDNDTGQPAEGLLDAHLGLGDIVICNGLVRMLAFNHPQIILPIWRRNLASVESLFSDLLNVRLLLLDHDMNFVGPGVIGMKQIQCAPGGSFDEHFYRKIGVPFACRWTQFKVSPLTKQYNIGVPWPFVLVHGASSDGHVIDRERIPTDVLATNGVECGTTWHRIEEYKDVPIGAWVKMIEWASQIHCIDSAFIHLVDSVPTTGKLFFHEYARPHGPELFALSKQWTVLR